MGDKIIKFFPTLSLFANINNIIISKDDRIPSDQCHVAFHPDH
jgi:hypothetical protein